MAYLIEKLTSRQFEVLAANYAKCIAPNYNWVLTKCTIDFNRDFEAVYVNKYKWGEAKHTQNPSSSISKSRWDPTIVSAVLRNNVDEIYLVTCGWIPLEYVVRAEHFKHNNIKRIFYINRCMLDEWLDNHTGPFDDFDEKTDLTRAMCSVKTDKKIKHSKDTCVINIFNTIDNMLEPISNVEAMVIYEINITTFSSSPNDLDVYLSDNFITIDDKAITLSPNNEPSCKSNIIKIESHYELPKGYNQILIKGFFKNASISKEIISVKMNNYTTRKVLLINKSKVLNKDKLSEISLVENAFNACLTNKHNIIINTYNLQKEDIIRNNSHFGEYNYYEFNGSSCSDAITLCQIITKLLLGVNYNIENEYIAKKTINNAINLCPFHLSNIFVGTTSHIYALHEIEQLFQNENELKLISQNIRLPKGTIIFIEKKCILSAIFQKVISSVLDLFTTINNSSMIVINTSFTEESPNKSIYSSQNKNESYDKISKKYKRNPEMQVIDSLWQKDSIDPKGIDYLRFWGDYYYEKTDFFKALFFYEIINKKGKNQIIDYTFKYADCLNHCDSMTKSQQQFERVISDGDANNPHESMLILEAKTEIFSLRFWRLNTEHLVEDIDYTLTRFHQQLYSKNKTPRDRYAFYNCLNRKMVTQYLIGDYENAESTFQQYIRIVDSDHINYLAFAYMDSARGLYKHNILLAQKRLELAFDILKKLYSKGKEKRRYFDCIVELEFVKFVTKYENGENPTIDLLEIAVSNVRNNGYKSMLIKCYLKLATCYLAQKNIDIATQYLSYVKSNCDFGDDIRTAFLYNRISSNLYCVKNMVNAQLNQLSDDFLPHGRISFNCVSDGIVILETRIW